MIKGNKAELEVLPGILGACGLPDSDAVHVRPGGEGEQVVTGNPASARREPGTCEEHGESTVEAWC
ncbi:MAG: hypothetical protein ACLQFR_21830 [Streptosporangiaceae bacterium]